MTVHELHTGKKIDTEQPTYFTYSWTADGDADFKFGGLTLEDVLYLKRILVEAEDEILAIFLGGEHQ
jgi:hypothetical protein